MLQWIKRILNRSQKTNHFTSTSIISKKKKKEIEQFKQQIQIGKNKNPTSAQSFPEKLQKNQKPSLQNRSHQPAQYNQHRLKPKSKESPSTSVVDSSIFNTEKKFDDLSITFKLAEHLKKLGFIYPSEIQEISIEHVIKDKNLVCSSPTGSGKTLAFIIPTIEKMIQKKINQIVVLAPTREIAIQIENNFKLFEKEFGLTTGLIIGGTDMLVQKKLLREYPNILIATPGRMMDVFQKGLVWLNYSDMVILDEVDLMMDMGFEKELNTIFKEFTPTIQVLAYTATLPEQIKNLLNKYIKNYETAIIGKRMETKKSVDHKFIKVDRKDKMKTLINLLKHKPHGKFIVFFNTIDETIKNYQLLRKNKVKKINCIHSRKSQEQRNYVMKEFKEESHYILLATDIASRGIDIPRIDYVVNYELPMDPEDYVHRIGRTGRADFKGKAITFFDSKNSKENVKLNQIKKLVKSSDGFEFIQKLSEI